MTSKDITITYGKEVGDCTRPYHVTLNRSDITVKEFIDYVLSEQKSEWGYIRIYNWGIKAPWDADYEFEYSHGVAKAEEVVPSWILASCIKQLAGNGGWSRSDWDIIIEGEEQMTYEENVKAILESNFAGFKEEIIDVACKSICGLSKKGRWEWKFDEKTGIRGMHCSVCGFAEAQIYKKFCGQCGADMREGDPDA